MVQISFRLKNPEAKRKTSIIIDLALGNRRLRRSIGHSVSPETWDTKRQRVVESSPVSPAINRALDEIRRAIWGLESEAQLAGIPLQDADVVRVVDESRVTRDRGTENTNQHETVLDSLDRWIANHEASRKNLTLKVWRTLRNHVERYQRRSRQTMYPSMMDKRWFDGFVGYLRVERGMCDSSIWKYVRAWKKYMRWIEENGARLPQTYRRVGQSDFRIQRSHAVRLTKRQFERLRQVDLTRMPGVDNARQLFVLQCCLGVRYSDLCRIVERPEDFLDGEMIRLRTRKTDAPVVIPVLPIARSILESERRPRAVSNQKYNKRLKIAAEKAGLTDPVIRVKWYGGESREERTRMCDLLSSHAAKRTFVTLMATAGVRTETIMKITGNSRSTIDAYVHLNENDVEEEVSQKALKVFGFDSD